MSSRRSSAQPDKTLDAILNRARSTLNQSRQFRDHNDNAKRINSPNPSALNNKYEHVNPVENSSGPVRKGLSLKGGPSLQKNASNVRFNPIESVKSIPVIEHKGDHEDQEFSKGQEGSSNISFASSGGDSLTIDDDDEGTITPPTMSEPGELRPMSLQGIPLDSSILKKSKKVLIERPLVFVSEESYAVVKAMAENGKAEENSASASEEPSKRESLSQKYSENFVSEIQSVADEFSQNFAKSISGEDDLEIPGTESIAKSKSIATEKSKSFNSSSATNPNNTSNNKSDIHRLQVVEEIKGNLQELFFGSDSSPSSTLKEEYDKDEEDDEVIITLHSKSKSHDKNYNDKEDYTEDFISLSGLEDDGGVVISPKSSTDISSRRSKSAAANSASKSSSKIKHSGSLEKEKSSSLQLKSKPSSKADDTNNMPSSSGGRLPSARKAFQETLSKVKLQDDDNEKYTYTAPKTKPQSQIHSILEKEVYRKELNRLRHLQMKEEKELKQLKDIKTKNTKTVQFIQKNSRFKQPSLAFAPSETEPYFKRDGSLGQGLRFEDLPRTPDENYISQVSKMDVPQLVQEVMNSNSRMYAATLRAAKDLSKEYGKNVKLLRKIKQSKAKATD